MLRDGAWLSGATLGLALLSGCASMGVHDDSAPGTNLDALSVFAWDGGRLEGTGRLGRDASNVESTVQDALLQGLSARGYRHDDDAANFRVSLLLSVEPRVFRTTLRDFDSVGRGYTGGGSTREIPYEFAYDAGTLAVEIRDVERGALLWRGWAEAAVHPDSDSTQRTARAHEAVGLILDRLPQR